MAFAANQRGTEILTARKRRFVEFLLYHELSSPIREPQRASYQTPG
jgi:hypothetical protein